MSEEEKEDECSDGNPRCKICGKPATRMVPACWAWICEECFTSTA